jgi:hypothetical protein
MTSGWPSTFSGLPSIFACSAPGQRWFSHQVRVTSAQKAATLAGPPASITKSWNRDDFTGELA